MEATRSILECMASEIILTEPLNTPAVIFKIIRVVFDIIDNAATFTFLFDLNTLSHLSHIILDLGINP